MHKNLSNNEVSELCSAFSSYLGVVDIKDNVIRDKVCNVLVVIAKYFLEKDDTESMVKLFANVIHNYEKIADIKIITDDNDRSIGIVFKKNGNLYGVGTTKLSRNINKKIKECNSSDCKGDC